MFGPTLAEKLFSRENRDQITAEELGQAIVEVAEKTHKHQISIKAIKKELRGLSPQNVGPQLDAIHAWMEDHIDAERRMINRQRYWNYSLGALTAIALILAAILLTR